MTRTLNVGGMDRALRLVVGFLLFVVGFLVEFGGAWTFAIFAVAVVLLVTGLVRFCPVNRLLGIDTCRRAA